MEQLQDKSTCADSDLKADMERWHKTKKKDFKRLFMDMCDRQIHYYEKVLVLCFTVCFMSLIRRWLLTTNFMQMIVLRKVSMAEIISTVSKYKIADYNYWSLSNNFWGAKTRFDAEVAFSEIQAYLKAFWSFSHVFALRLSFSDQFLLKVCIDI